MCFVFLCDEEERELGRKQASGSCPHCGGKEAGAVSILELSSKLHTFPGDHMNIPIKMAASPKKPAVRGYLCWRRQDENIILGFLREEDEIFEMGSSSLLWYCLFENFEGYPILPVDYSLTSTYACLCA
ncbi:hypothetical protein OIU84_001016 [Salix udensis]|uniref:Uncharacterized protein n=1 Tax=Salix udensis TaxID=889485 RepID=A0AAD6L8D4_9ROSI|nr:hypothetical protein OIU84_001016 [Salix udensis]